MGLLIGAVIGIVVTIVGVCLAEPAYRNIVEQETIEKIEKTLPTEILVHVKDLSGKEWDITVPINLLAFRREKHENRIDNSGDNIDCADIGNSGNALPDAAENRKAIRGKP